MRGLMIVVTTVILSMTTYVALYKLAISAGCETSAIVFPSIISVFLFYHVSVSIYSLKSKNMSPHRKQAMERIMHTQSDYIHCDYIYPDGHKCGITANHFKGGMEDRNGNINSFMLCDEHKYITGFFTLRTPFLISSGVAILSLPLATLHWSFPIVIFGFALMITNIYGYFRKV